MMVRKKHERKRPKGSLTIIAIMLIASAVLRFGGNAGPAMALNSQDSDRVMTSVKNEQLEIIDDEGIRKMLEALQSRESAVAEKEELIRKRMQALRIADGKVSEKITQLESAEKRLRETLTIAQTAAEDDIVRLTQVYENMKPKQAAALFEEMDPHFAAGFLGRMRPDAAASIMAGLSAEAANLYSVILAGRNADASKD